MNPEYPLFIPSKGRARVATTPRFLDSINVPYRLVIEPDELRDYNLYFPKRNLLLLDLEYKDKYETLDEWGDAKGVSPGPGPARNFIWDTAVKESSEYHWIMDDNITLFARLHKNARIPFGDGTPFAAMEDFITRYKNVGMGGPQYWMFAPSRAKLPPFVTGTRIYSCNLIRNDIPYRWRGRYNEDTILSLDMLKDGWNTIQFNAFLQYKLTTQTLPGGNTDAFYASEGTLPKSQLLVNAHPDVAKLSWKFGRWHHHVNYNPYKKLPLIPRDDYTPPTKNPYTLKKQPRSKR